MARRRIKLPSFNAVAASQTATIDIPTGPRYHNIKVFYKDNADQATIENDITLVKIKTNGKVQRTFKPSELFKMLAQNGINFIDGILPIYFSEPYRRNVLSEDTLAWGTADVETFQIEFDIAAGAVAPKLHAYAVVDNVAAALRDIIKVRRQTVQVTQSGLLTLLNLDKRMSETHHRFHCFEAADGDILGAEIRLDGYEVFNANVAVNNANLMDQKIIAQDGLFSIIFDDTQRIDDGLRMNRGTLQNPVSVQDFQVHFDMANAGSFTLVTETRGNPE